MLNYQDQHVPFSVLWAHLSVFLCIHPFDHSTFGNQTHQYQYQAEVEPFAKLSTFSVFLTWHNFYVEISKKMELGKNLIFSLQVSTVCTCLCDCIRDGQSEKKDLKAKTSELIAFLPGGFIESEPHMILILMMVMNELVCLSTQVPLGMDYSAALNSNNGWLIILMHQIDNLY